MLRQKRSYWRRYWNLLNAKKQGKLRTKKYMMTSVKNVVVFKTFFCFLEFFSICAKFQVNQ